MEKYDLKEIIKEIKNITDDFEKKMSSLKIAYLKLNIASSEQSSIFLHKERAYKKGIKNLEKELKYTKNKRNPYIIDMEIE